MAELVYIVKWPPRGTQAGDVVVHSSALETTTSMSKSCPSHFTFLIWAPCVSPHTKTRASTTQNSHTLIFVYERIISELSRGRGKLEPYTATRSAMVALAVQRICHRDLYLLHDGCPSSLSCPRTVTPPFRSLLQDVARLSGYYVQPRFRQPSFYRF